MLKNDQGIKKGGGLWSICIATVPARKKQLAELMSVLLPQVEKFKDVEILIFFNNFEWSLGYLRQAMIEEAHGEYVSHVDDDDMVPDDYVDAIRPLLDGTDYIGFKVKFIDNGKHMNPVYHSLKYSHWSQDDKGYYRGITHLNPLKRTLALEAGFPVERMTGEDEKWAAKVKAQTEHFIDRDMYEYRHVHNDSVAYAENDRLRGLKDPHTTPRRPMYKSKNVRFHSESTKC